VHLAIRTPADPRKGSFCFPPDASRPQKQKDETSKTIEVLNHTRFERITFRSGVERATVAPAVLAFA
jgi:hypothetical protein